MAFSKLLFIARMNRAGFPGGGLKNLDSAISGFSA
jgi:hypothetical protein